MADPELYQDQERFAELNNEYTSLSRQLKRSYSDWEQAQAKIEEMEAQLEG
jgi:septal ring factor EnvC (AmiA/AmiB activator)